MQAELASATIRTYRSALSTWWEEGLLDGGSQPRVSEQNPTTNIAVERVLTGVRNALRPAELAARASRPATIAMTPALLRELESHARGSDPQSIMRWAAANTATYGLLRPSEFLGSPQHRDRALQARQITFFARAGSELPRALCPMHASKETIEAALPDRFTIALGVTKADQQARNAPLAIAAQPAIRALWRWMHIRRDLCPGAETELFRVPRSPPLSCKELTAHLENWIEAAGHDRPKITGKAFRRGGASGLMASGAARADIAAAGRWRSVAMVETYSNRQSKAARALEVSRRMALH